MTRSELIKILQKKGPLPSEEVNEIVRYLKDNMEDSEVMGLFFEKSKRVMYRVVNKYVTESTEPDDLYQESFFALRKAIEKFDPDKGVNFWTYAYSWVNRFAEGYSVENRLIRFPAHAFWDYLRISKITDGFSNDISSKEIAQKLNLTEKQVAAIIAGEKRTYFYADKPYGESEDETYIDMIEDESCNVEGAAEEDIYTEDILESLDAALKEVIASKTKSKSRQKELYNKLRTLLIMHYGLDGNPPRTLKEIADTMGCSKQSLSALEKTYFSKLKEDTRLREKYETL